MMAKDMVDPWRMVCKRRMEFNRWELAPPPNFQRHDDPNMRISLPVAGRRNIDRTRRRWQRATTTPISEEQGPLTLVDGNAIQIQSEHEMVPDLPQGSFSLNPHYGFADSLSESRQEVVDNQTMPNV